jgi:hypothetical protein
MMAKKAVINRTLNILNLVTSIIVFGTGLILFTQFHVGDGAYHTEWLGHVKSFWLNIHRAAAITFSIGFALHFQTHWKYIKTVAKRWRVNLPEKVKSTTREQVLLLSAALIVVCAGFYAWIMMPGATLENETFHHWIDMHNIVGITFLIGISIHIIRRWGRIFHSRQNARLRSTSSLARE